MRNYLLFTFTALFISSCATTTPDQVRAQVPVAKYAMPTSVQDSVDCLLPKMDQNVIFPINAPTHPAARKTQNGMEIFSQIHVVAYILDVRPLENGSTIDARLIDSNLFIPTLLEGIDKSVHECQGARIN